MSDFEDRSRDASAQRPGSKKRKLRKSSDLKSCDRCRSQHLKCVYDSEVSTCQRCAKSRQACVRSSKEIRFRDVPVSRFRSTRSKSTVTTIATVNTARKPSEILPPTESTKFPAKKTSSEQHDRVEVAGQGPTPHQLVDNESALVPDYDSASDIIDREISVDDSAFIENDRHTRSLDIGHLNGPAQPHFGIFTPGPFNFGGTPAADNFVPDDLTLARIFSSDQGSTASFSRSPRNRWSRSGPTRYLDQLVKPSTNDVADESRGYLETILMRYFHEELAPWFDLCDPDRHFAFVVPQKAREPGPLRSALLTIAARNLARNKRFRNSAGIVQWRGRLLPDLKEEFAMPYHNDCIQNLLSLSLDPKKLHDERLLAAIIALRTDEEMGHEQEGEEDQQLFLKIMSLFIDAQLPPSLALPHSSPEVFHSTLLDNAMTQSNIVSPFGVTNSDTETDLGASGLRQACFWTAFRQDLHAAFLKQQPVRFPLQRCEAFRQLTPATDAIWANRMVTFCADVLEFVYGSESVDATVAPAYTNPDRWKELKGHEENLCTLLPASFQPTYSCEPNASRGSIFPEIWYLEPCHVSGTTYIELARILLEVFNPTRPRLGHGFLAATNAFISTTKRTLFRLCGIALSNHHCPPSLINACLAISLFGEYFEDPVEQDALLGVLALMSYRYAYPTSQIANSLKREWGREDMSFDVEASMPTMDHMAIG